MCKQLGARIRQNTNRIAQGKQPILQGKQVSLATYNRRTGAVMSKSRARAVQARRSRAA